MNVLEILRASGFVPAVPASCGEVGTTQTLVESHVPAVPTVPVWKSKTCNGTADTSTTDQDDASLLECRNRLQTMAVRLGLGASLVQRIPHVDLPLWDMVPAGALPSYLLALDDTATRQAGKVPLGDNAAIYCERCGPVYAHPGIAAVLPEVAGWPRALGCPWCFIRAASGAIPRPLITCENCKLYAPDRINPTGGTGACAIGHESNHPMTTHTCANFQPDREKNQ